MVGHLTALLTALVLTSGLLGHVVLSAKEPVFVPVRIDGPPQYAPCAGMKVSVADLDGNGKSDIVVSGRTGLYAFYHRGFSPTPASQRRIPRGKEPSFPKVRTALSCGP